MGGTTSLSCQGERGIPLPKVTKWTKDSKAIAVGTDYQISPGKTLYQELLEIHNFGINHLGVYECFVANKLGSSSCAMNISGKQNCHVNDHGVGRLMKATRIDESQCGYFW